VKKAWEFFLANFDALIAIVVSLIAVIVSIFGSDGNQLVLLGGISATLAVLSYSIIRDRRNRKVLENQLTVLQRNLPDRPSAISFFRKTPDLAPFIQQANQIDLCGVTLTNTLNRQFAILRERLDAGGTIRLLVIDPASHAIEMSAQRSTSPKDMEYYQRRLESALSDITYLIKYNNDRKQTKGRNLKSGNISVRLLSYAPSYGICSFDKKKNYGRVFVEIYPHKYGFKVPPTFELNLENDGEWYAYFVDQFEQMWDAASPWDQTAYLQKIPFET
jgi:hypothetical protein